MRILALSPHPDDLEIGCGGTLLKYARNGADITALVLSDGSLGGDANVRLEEQEEAARVLGIRRVLWGGFRDADLPGDREVIDRIEAVIKEVEPRFLFAPWSEDTHQDHRQIARAALSATRYTRNVLFYEGPTSVNFQPKIFVDVGEVLDEKLAALKAHRSQIEKTHIEDLPITTIAESLANFRGTQARTRFAEGFEPVRLFINV